MRTQFQVLDSFLCEHQLYWRAEPFYECHSNELPWDSINPQLSHWVSKLTPEEVVELKCNPDELLEQLTPFFPKLPELYRVTVLPPCDRDAPLDLPRGIETGVPGRKLEQILSMGNVALTNHHGKEWLEWCSGKGFLGRILAQQSKQKVTSFEWQQSLCDSGQQLADEQNLAMHFVQGDALSDLSNAVFRSDQHAVALHACGDLHTSLLTKAVAHSLPAVTISPCCYHLIQAEYYQPLSHLGQSSPLVLSKSDLRIPLQETVTGGERVRRHRMTEMIYRLAFSQILKEELNIEHPIPVPSVKKSALSEGFTAFCYWAADKKSVMVPEDIDFDRYEEKGEALFWQMERLSLIQQVFRRPLELWLALDKGLFLQQAGYQVFIKEFCEKSITPRNILIHAQK